MPFKNEDQRKKFFALLQGGKKGEGKTSRAGRDAALKELRKEVEGFFDPSLTHNELMFGLAGVVKHAIEILHNPDRYPRQRVIEAHALPRLIKQEADKRGIVLKIDREALRKEKLAKKKRRPGPYDPRLG
jgi:hypothetical protein